MIHGNQIGADLLAGQWAKSKGLKVAWYRADWHGYGKAAGGLKTGISSCFKTSRVIGRPYSGHISDIRRRNNNVPTGCTGAGFSGQKPNRWRVHTSDPFGQIPRANQHVHSFVMSQCSEKFVRRAARLP